MCSRFSCVFFFQAEDGIRDLVRSRGLGDVYKRQVYGWELGGIERPGNDQNIDGVPFKKMKQFIRQGLSLIHI